jgi:hypothetical protein
MSSLSHVTGYPFSLGWSEGNRLWDYSILFGRDRYDFPRDKEIAVYLDVGRQIIGGIPFLFPGLTIVMERMWLGLTLILPYILLGLASFRSFFRKKYLWLAMILWTFLFLKQGPIHAPLILCAALVILAWKSRLWFSIPLVIFATYIATVSRYTWVFAPFLWFFMLELFDGLVGGEKRIYLTPRIRSLLFLSTLGVILGFLFFEIGVYFKIDWLLYGYGLFSGLKVSPEFIQEKIQQQPLLWYRLLPNETYGNGILIGLVVAICPLLLVLFYLIKSKVWTPSVLQILTIAFPTLAFFVVGIIVSVKIGGGADLHNMDMFLIALFFIAVIAAHCEIEGWWENNRLGPWWVQSALVMLIAVPAFGPLMEMRSYNFGSAATWLRTLADVRNERSLDMYPADAVISQSLLTIQREVDSAKTSGDILFMDQRQLLTFKFIQNVALVPEYDKKILMEQALRSNQGYFEEFYNNLREKQFALIITQPLNTPQKGGDSQFGEENDAWVKWVSIPLLCFYEVKQTLLDVNVQLLVPRHGSVDCTNILPSEGLN